MSNKNKRNLILESIIRKYLEDNIPVSSSELGSRMPMNIPASTVRVYFKKLSQEGAITQLHISGGRIPTDMAMKNYWLTRINTDDTINLKDKHNLKKIVDNFGVYCLINIQNKVNFTDIINAKNRYLILIFDEDELVIKHNQKIEKFLTSILGCSLEEFIKICNHAGLFNLYSKARKLLDSKVLFQRGKSSIFQFIEENQNDDAYNFFTDKYFSHRFQNGIAFDEILPKGCIAIKQDAIFYGDHVKMLCLGNIYTDFEQFFKKAKEEV